RCTAQATIQALEKKVDVLEAIVKSTQEQATCSHFPPPPSVQLSLSGPKKSDFVMETVGPRTVELCRTRATRAWEEFEAKARQVNEGLEEIAALDLTVNVVQQTQTSQGH
ncbi:hypothetical protein AX14_004063, partial [Amanita brunnescens Koide BX004]